ncbi:MAG: restriction endonuclease [Chloroflexota bacterium]
MTTIIGSASKITLTQSGLISAAKEFCLRKHIYSRLFGITDGKAVGTFIEREFQEHLESRYTVQFGSSALGLDLPALDTDIKVTSVRQPQSSCPFRSARQKVYDILAFLADRNLPGDEIVLNSLANEIMQSPPALGYLTISNALQWRLQYGRIVGLNEPVSGIAKIV